MRVKLIAVFAVAVLLVGGLSFALTRVVLGGLSTGGDPQRSAAATVAQLQVDGLLIERWLVAQAQEPAVREPFNAGTPAARSEAATAVANRIREGANGALGDLGRELQLVALVDGKGTVLGRNGSQLMRGDDLGAVYPALKASLEKGLPGADLWLNPKRNEQLFAAYVPVRGADGAVVGALVVGSQLNDGRATAASDKTSGLPVVVVASIGDKIEIVAKSSGVDEAVQAALEKSSVRDDVKRLLGSPSVTGDVGNLPSQYRGSARLVEGYGSGRRAAVVSVAVERAGSFLAPIGWSILGATALGLVVVIVCAFLLDNYLSRPISELEDGLLAIMNGKQDLRFEIEHAELGGLVFRINSLLNQLFGVQEDETDDEGRVSRAPTGRDFQEALAVDERMATVGADGSTDVEALRAEADDAYYERIFREYLKAKRELGDPTDHITKDAFTARLTQSEREMAEKHGKPVRFKVEVRGKEVVLLAVPLA